MKRLIPILLIFTACTKQNSLQMATTLKAVPEATVNGKTITLTANKSEGEITKYGWQLDISSPTTSPVTYAPSSSHKGGDFVPITATVIKPGVYEFGLTVYDTDGQDYQKIQIEVK